MKIENLYFEVPYPIDGRILSFCIHQCRDQCPPNKNGKALVKLPVGAKIPSVLKNYEPLTHEQAKTKIAKWRKGMQLEKK